MCYRIMRIIGIKNDRSGFSPAKGESLRVTLHGASHEKNDKCLHRYAKRFWHVTDLPLQQSFDMLG